MKNYGIILMLLCLLASCAGRDNFDEEAMPNCAVSFTPALVAVATKGDPASSCLAKNSKVQISAYLTSGGVEAADYSQSQLFTVSDNNGTLTTATNMLLMNKKSYKFYAYSPDNPFIVDSKKIINVNHGDDFMIAQVESSVEGKASTISLPVMSRKCSKVDLLVRRSSTNQKILNFNIGSEGLTLSRLTHSPIPYTLGEGEIKINGVTLDGKLTVLGSAFTTQTAGIEYLASSVMLPKVSSEFLLNLTIVLSKGPVVLNALIPAIAFLPGRQYLYLVEISDDIIKVCVVLDWNKTSSDFVLGAPNSMIAVGSWTVNNSMSTNAGAGNTNATVGPWIVNPAWNALLGAANFNASVTGWNVMASMSTVAGAGNTNATVTPWGAGDTTHSAGVATGGGSVSGWGSTITAVTGAGE